MPDNRPHDMSGLTGDELEWARRDLRVSLSLSAPGSAVAVPILARLNAVNMEIAARTAGSPAGLHPAPQAPVSPQVLGGVRGTAG